MPDEVRPAFLGGNTFGPQRRAAAFMKNLFPRPHPSGSSLLRIRWGEGGRRPDEVARLF